MMASERESRGKRKEMVMDHQGIAGTVARRAGRSAARHQHSPISQAYRRRAASHWIPRGMSEPSESRRSLHQLREEHLPHTSVAHQRVS